MQKIRKILRPVSEKSALPTSQPTNYYQQHRFYRTWQTPEQKEAFESNWLQNKSIQSYIVSTAFK